MCCSLRSSVGGDFLKGGRLDVVLDRGWALDAFPEAVRLADGGLPEAKSPVFAARGVQLSVRREPDAVDGSEMAFEGFWKKT